MKDDQTITEFMQTMPRGLKFWYFWIIQQPEIRARVRSRTERFASRMRNWLHSNAVCSPASDDPPVVDWYRPKLK